MNHRLSVLPGGHSSWFPSRILIVLLIAGLVGGCSLFEEETVNATVSGQVTDDVGAPLPGATVTATFSPTSERAELTSVTNDDGQYVFSFSIEEEEEVTLSIRAKLNEAVIGQRDLTVSQKNRKQTDINFVLAKGGDSDGLGQPSTESGTVSRIAVSKQSGTVIRVRESGGEESVSITFVAVDSIGRRLASDKAVDMRFSFGYNPQDGLEVNPSSVETNALGEATAVVTSGTRSGVVQLIAEATAADGGTVRSDPVRITIHGGMPAQERFTIGPTIRNIPGLVRFNETTDIEVIVGDKYGNPVVPGTGVYFTTSHGVIGGSIETDNDGLGSVLLRSGNPLPGTDGIAIAAAETADENGNPVTGETPVIFSGLTTIQVQPDTAGFGSYDLVVADPLGNPLTSGTTVEVSVEGTGVLVSGYTSTTLDDTRVRTSDSNGDGRLQRGEVTVETGSGITDFPFTVSRDPTSPQTPEVTAVKISVVSSNGNLDVSLFPSSSSKSSRSTVHVVQDASVTRLGTGAVQIQLENAV